MALSAVPAPPGEHPPPAHLSEPMREFWSQVLAAYNLEDHHRLLLEGACTAWDRATEARRILDAEGPSITNRFGEPRPHPMCAVEKESLRSFQLLLRELDLDAEPPALAPVRRSTRYR